jgi:hypothetical protein
MGIYLNPGSRRFEQSVNSDIYVDKTGLIAYTNSVLRSEMKFVCVSRPRRFGKSMGAKMLAAYYGRGIDSKGLFAPFEIASHPSFDEHANRYDVLFLNMRDFLTEAESDVVRMLALIQEDLMEELAEEYGPSVGKARSLVSAMRRASAASGATFVVIIDEWDCIFRVDPEGAEAQKTYLDFLRLLLKDKDHVALAYMTGILPIKKYGEHSALNMFDEFSMTEQGPLARLTGFTQGEVAALCEGRGKDLSRMEAWYNGYRLTDERGESFQVYNPRSVVTSIHMGDYRGYWTSTETYEALRVYIDYNMDGLRDIVTGLLAGEPHKTDPLRFANDMTTFRKADDVLTLLVHLGYLGFSPLPGEGGAGEVFIPNREIQQEYVRAMKRGGWPKVIEAVEASRALLSATWDGDAGAVAQGVDAAHLETSILNYNSEEALSHTLSLAYYAAREYYTVVREMPAGKGFADMAFIPRRHHPEAPAMLVELKWDKGVQTALDQIHERRYPEAFSGCEGELLLVGVSYDKDSKLHECTIERVRM